MSFHRTVIAFFLALALVPAASAKGPKEVFLDSAGLEMMGGAGRLSLAPGFNWGFFDWLQAGGQLAYQSLSYGDDSVNTTTIRLGPTFNMGGPYATATFIFLGYAIRKGSGTVADPLDDPSGSGLALMVGRRIPLFSTVTYRPSIGLQMAGKSSFIINALAVSYFF
jgi:hypothetical protein